MGAGAAALGIRAARRGLGARPVRPRLEALTDKLPMVAAHLEAARADVLAFTAFPKEVWRQVTELEPLRAAQPGDPAPHRRGRHLSRPRRPHPAGRRRARRAARRMNRRPPLPRPGCPRPLPHPTRHRVSHRHHRGGDHPGAQRLTPTEDHAAAVTHHARGLDRVGTNPSGILLDGSSCRSRSVRPPVRWRVLRKRMGCVGRASTFGTTGPIAIRSGLGDHSNGGVQNIE